MTFILRMLRPILTVAILVLFVPLNQQAFAGPISPFFLTGVEFGGSAGNVPKIKVVQGASVINSWTNATNSGGDYFGGYALAVNSTVRTLGYGSNSVLPSGNFGAEYTLGGTFTGTTYPTPAIALNYFYDGTTDSTHNYTMDPTGHVWSFDSNWQNSAPLFSLSPSGGLWIGITFDSATNSLWLATHNLSINRIENYTLSGSLLSSFAVTGSGLATALGFDPADQTLWVAREDTSPFSNHLQQYSGTGQLLSDVAYADLQNFDITGGEFPFQQAGVPEPGTLCLLGLGTFCLGWWRRRLLRAVPIR